MRLLQYQCKAAEIPIIIVFEGWDAAGKGGTIKRVTETLDPFRSYKLTKEDWRNRVKRNQYFEAVEDMLEKTFTVWAPWTVVEANDKFHARVKVARTITEALERSGC